MTVPFLLVLGRLCSAETPALAVVVVEAAAGPLELQLLDLSLQLGNADVLLLDLLAVGADVRVSGEIVGEAGDLSYTVRTLLPNLGLPLTLYLVRRQHLVGDLPALSEGDGVLALTGVGLVFLETVVKELLQQHPLLLGGACHSTEVPGTILTVKE